MNSRAGPFGCGQRSLIKTKASSVNYYDLGINCKCLLIVSVC